MLGQGREKAGKGGYRQAMGGPAGRIGPEGRILNRIGKPCSPNLGSTVSLDLRLLFGSAPERALAVGSLQPLLCCVRIWQRPAGLAIPAWYRIAPLMYFLNKNNKTLLLS